MKLMKSLEQRVAELENQVNGLVRLIVEQAAKVDAPKPGTYGSSKKWTPEQHESLRKTFAEQEGDLIETTNAHNVAWGPKGFTERSPTAIACQLYKIMEHDELDAKIISLAEKYMK
jgi:hypothetical protein